MTAATELKLDIARQPDEQTCGPTALHAVYRYYGDDIATQQVIDEVTFLPGGGTLAVYLGLHAMGRGYRVTIYTSNVTVFDPTWFTDGAADADLCDKLRRQHAARRSRGRGGSDRRLGRATRAYCEYVSRGGRVRMEDLTLELLAGYVRRRVPIVAGLSATWLYRSAREREEDYRRDDIAGQPLGHFVVLHGVDAVARRISVADPYVQTPYPGAHHYQVDVDRVIGAIYLGVVTYDAKLLIIEKPTADASAGATRDDVS